MRKIWKNIHDHWSQVEKPEFQTGLRPFIITFPDYHHLVTSKQLSVAIWFISDFAN